MRTLLCTAGIFALICAALHSCAAQPVAQPATIADFRDPDTRAAAYSAEDVATCQVLTAANAAVCDVDGGMASGDMDAAE
jgi:hypothetical protein